MDVPRRDFILLAVLFAAVAAIRISAPSDIATGDQSMEVAYVRAIVERGAWIVQHDAAGIPASKPPLFNWLAAASFLLAGHNSELLLKLPSLVAAAGTLLLTVMMARSAAGPRAGLYAGVFLVCSTMFAKQMYFARTDMLLTFGICGQMWAALAGQPTAFAAFAAVALMSKGPVGVLIPLVALAGLWTWEGTLRDRVRSLRMAAGLLVAFIPLAAWFAAALAVGGAEVWKEMVVRETIDRFAEGSKSMEHKHPFYYLPYFLGRMAPASFPAVAALFLLRWRRGDRQEPVAFAAWWLLAPLVVLSLIPSKRADRLFPLLPAAAILAGWAVDRWFSGGRSRGTAAALVLICAIVLGGGVAAVGMVWVAHKAVDPSLVPAAITSGIVLIVCGAAMGVALIRRRAGAAVASLAAAMLVIIGAYQYRFSLSARAHSKSTAITSSPIVRTMHRLSANTKARPPGPCVSSSLTTEDGSPSRL